MDVDAEGAPAGVGAVDDPERLHAATATTAITASNDPARRAGESSVML
jgi:hypothetical protein